jgi:bifunctional non-homologous end joining protein LigD
MHRENGDISGAKEAGFPREFEPMKAALADTAFDRQGWIYEPKMDGIRAIAMIKQGKITLTSRRGLDLARSYPEIVHELSTYGHDLIFDGEIIALDERGMPSFQVLQQRSGLTATDDVRKASQATPIYYYIFDIVYLDNYSLLNTPLEQRKRILRETLIESDHIRLLDRIETDGITAFKAAAAVGLEGIIAKRLDSRYEPGGRSKAWLKVKATVTAEFVICGYTEGTGSRSQHFGALLLGYYRGGKLVYAGGCGTGFTEQTLASLNERLLALRTTQSPFLERIPGKYFHWVRPELVAEIKFQEWTREGNLRAPVFLHLRPDKSPTECTVAQVNQSLIDEIRSFKTRGMLQVDGEEVALTNLEKTYWPTYEKQSPITKRDYILYLLSVSPWLLPHMKDRPLTFLRFPNGISGGKFYQKHWDQGLPSFVETFSLFGESNKRDQRYIVCNNLATLIWLAQVADLELHTWQSRIEPGPDAFNLQKTFTGSVAALEASLLNYPDYMLFDLDPYLYSGKERSGDEPELHRRGFKKTVQLAHWLKEILDSLPIESFVKTTGKTGLHIYVPIVREFTFDDVRALSETIGRVVLDKHPGDVTMEWAVVKRKGKVFLDHNMNSRGKTLASIYSPRVSPEAAVSFPIRWDQLDDIYPTDFTMRNVPDLLAKQGDLWSDILNHKNDLAHRLQNPPKQQKTKRRAS